MAEHVHDNNDDCELEPYDPGPVPEENAPPTPLLEGSFAFFSPAPGQLLLVWRKKGDTKDNYLPIPPVVLQMASQMGGMSFEDITSKIASGNLG